MRVLRTLLVCSAVVLAGADDGCGAEDCVDREVLVPSLYVRFEAPCWPAGSYEVRGTIDGAPFSIPVELPAAPGAELRDGPAMVGVSPDLARIVSLGVTPEDLEDPPAEVELEVVYRGTAVLHVPLEPDYRRGDPDQCGPTNPVAAMNVGLPETSRPLLCGARP